MSRCPVLFGQRQQRLSIKLLTTLRTMVKVILPPTTDGDAVPVEHRDFCDLLLNTKAKNTMKMHQKIWKKPIAKQTPTNEGEEIKIDAKQLSHRKHGKSASGVESGILRGKEKAMFLAGAKCHCMATEEFNALHRFRSDSAQYPLCRVIKWTCKANQMCCGLKACCPAADDDIGMQIYSLVKVVLGYVFNLYISCSRSFVLSHCMTHMVRPDESFHKKYFTVVDS
ncbi:hypothetical protein COOONC_16360 [Cooperia oncophora]